ncbi:MAG: S-layer homology domain-containing protein [Deltaproteobacteria bacterium]
MLRRISGIICVLLCTWLLLFPLSGAMVYALTASSAVNGSTMTISGQAVAGSRVSVIVERSDGKRSYLGQTTATSSGSYSLSLGLGQGTYQASVSSAGQQAQTAQQAITGNPVNPDGGGGGGAIVSAPDSTAARATVSITGDSANGVMLTATVWQWAGTCTVLEALKGVLNSQGIKYQLGTGGYVAGIGNLTEKKPGYPMSGWLFRVNGVFLPSGAESTIIKNGDSIEWLYTMDGGKDMGTPAITPEQVLLVNEQTSKELTTMLENYGPVLSSQKGSSLINAKERMTAAEAQLLGKKLDANQVMLESTLPANGGIIYDPDQELVAFFPAGALAGEMALKVTEEKGTNGSADGQFQLRSGVYNLQPDGSRFARPVRIAIRFMLLPALKAENLAPAWFDTTAGQWEAIPGIIDLKTGTAVFDTTHFSSFAVVEKTETSTIQAKSAMTENGFDYTEVEQKYPWALTAIKGLSSQGIMVGSKRGFEPGRVITRAELAALLQRSLEPQNTKPDLELRDVPAGAWYYPVMQTAVKAGWISGYPDKTYHPDYVVNRYEAAGMLYNALSGSKPAAQAGKASYNDYGEAPAWARPALGYIAAKGLMQGYPDGSFGGSKPMNRAQAAVIIWGMLNDK